MVVINRDISWLSFNERVLQEAQDKSVPLIERMRFLGIYSNNLDEFFRVRVATLLRLKKALAGNEQYVVEETENVLKQIQSQVIDLQSRFYDTYEQILEELEKENIFIKDDLNLSLKQEIFVRDYFVKNVESLITPIILSNLKKFPYIKDRSVYLFISFTKKSEKKLHALIELPTDYMSRFLVLPSDNVEHNIIYLDDVIRYNMKFILSIFEPRDIESYIIKLTRDAELDLDDDISESYYEKITKSLSNRKKGRVVRFVYDKAMPKVYLDYLMTNIKLTASSSLIPGGKYHNFRDFMSFPSLGHDHLRYKQVEPLDHLELKESTSILKSIAKNDVLLQFPYHFFDYIIDIIREAAIDPKVVGIKMCLYRVAPKSKIINALKNAARNGKQVYVVIELQARFDEEANLEWSKQLNEENIHVEFGLKGLKVHSKLLLIQRKSKGEMRNYAVISTGNFHESTATVYGDTALLTADSRVSNEVEQVFQLFKKPYLPYVFNHLLVAPINLRKALTEHIDSQTLIAKNGGEGRIFIKVNNLVDDGIIHHLNNAAKNGVQIKLLVRGVCSLIPSHNIKIRSIIGRYLEHSRIFWFGSETGDLYLGSADLMTRNLDVRIEALTPIYNEKIKSELITYLNLQWSDNQGSRVLDENLGNEKYINSKEPIDSQIEMYNLLRT
ncbi:MAG: polyphosphate kinase 1 [Bacteroidetes bacterium]|nr:MAG: polyphosphate kinase 1 [Bacteroidota bacterium]